RPVGGAALDTAAPPGIQLSMNTVLPRPRRPGVQVIAERLKSHQATGNGLYCGKGETKSLASLSQEGREEGRGEDQAGGLLHQLQPHLSELSARRRSIASSTMTGVT